MSITPWYTSQTLIQAIQRKIAIPLNQRTFIDTDILAFAAEELLIDMVPDILRYHQEYFVWSEDVILNPNQQRYPIPERAMGMRLRDLFYVDTNGNLFEMTRINADDKAYWQRESATISLMQKYYLEGNDIVLAPQNIQSPTGTLRFSYFIRPNQLVDDAQAAIIKSFFTNLTVNSSLIALGDTLTIGPLGNQVVFTAVTGAPVAGEFELVPGNDLLTSTNLHNAIILDGTYSASLVGTNIVSLIYTNLGNLYKFPVVFPVSGLVVNIVSSNPTGLLVSSQIGLNTTDVSSNIVDTVLIDFLQTKSGHRLYAKDVPIIPGSVSTNAIAFNNVDVPLNLLVGDYICQQYECIIPQIPTDLHSGLAERVCARILAAQGDMQGLQISQGKMTDIKQSEGILTENRVDGSVEKVNQRKSIMSMQRMGIRRRI
jgi:hypothetical protein